VKTPSPPEETTAIKEEDRTPVDAVIYGNIKPRQRRGLEGLLREALIVFISDSRSDQSI